MTDNPFYTTPEGIAAIQQQAIDWDEGAMLVLAGPGSGKTQVLTCRIARLLDAGRDKGFRILALTFTNKAADEMKERVSSFVPGLEARANIGTFHSFCAQVLRQHGVHIGIKPDFVIYSQDNDRHALFHDAIRKAVSEGKDISIENTSYLGLIDRMKARLIPPHNAQEKLLQLQDSQRIELAYCVYEKELKRLNALDFNSLIFQVHHLFTSYPAIAARYRRSYPYWLFDEFQDTNHAQYSLIRAMAGDEFRNIFVVADDDQIIYQWNGASFRQLQRLRADFSAELIQLPTNYRCPPVIVKAANRLVVFNEQRAEAKKPLVAGRTVFRLPEEEHIQFFEFETEEEEAQAIAKKIASLDESQWGQVAVLARTRSLLNQMKCALSDNHVRATVAQRRDDFLSAQFRWFVACLTQILRPLDKHNIAVLVEAFNCVAEINVAVDQVLTDAEATGKSYFSVWLQSATRQTDSPLGKKVLHIMEQLDLNPSGTMEGFDKLVEVIGSSIGDDDTSSDLSEDVKSWGDISRDIKKHLGRNIQLDQFLQQLQLRSKEPSPQPKTVTLMTIHGAKGREFDIVYVIGLAEDIMPSYQSLGKGANSPEMEEERRNCFVAITRAKESLTLSRAREYRGWAKKPSRFLYEMGLIE